MLLSKVPGHFKARRDRLMKANPSAAFVLPAAAEVGRNPDVNHPFRQESNFFYLCGFEEPEAFLVLAPSASKGSYKTVLFVRRRNQEMEMWEGERYGIERAMNVFGADEAYPIDELDTKLIELLKPADRVFYRINQSEHEDRRVLGVLEKLRRSQGRSGKSMVGLLDPNETIGELRLFKQPEEVEAMRKAGRASAEAHKQLMREVKPGMNEFEVQALIDYLFLKNGCQRLGYPSIVAGGVNATCLHYRFNNDALKDGDLLLIDAGGEFDYYTADITRTFPVGKKFTKPQATIYDLVLKSQMAAMEMAKPGSKLADIHRRASDVLIDGMLSLGFLKGDPKEIWDKNIHKRFYPHGTGHWLGMDVHDVGLYLKNGEPRPLEAGMVFTIEPGFYVQPGDKEAPSDYRDIGIRIEDDILITANGHENLTAAVPKTRDEIEALRA